MRISGCLVATFSVLTAAVANASITEESIIVALQEANKFMEDGYGYLADNEGTLEIEEIQQELEGLKTLHEQLQRQEKEVERLVSLFNARQLEDLAAQLSTLLKKELMFRKLSSNDSSSSTMAEDSTYVLSEELERQLDVKALLGESESQLSEWILKVAQEEVDAFKKSTLESIPQVKRQSSGCPDVAEIVQGVQVELTKFSQDSIGLIDHAQGADVVYSMTSPTYEPLPSQEEKLGNIWWRRYIPEDWEQILPDGWEDWSIKLPSFIYHSLNINGGKTAPPEATLEKKILPGSCWPMNGSSGQVTIRLPYPIKIESFTIDHVSRQIISEDSFDTVPKKMKVVAYPPCENPQKCGGIGFDASDPMEVAQFEYEIDGPVIQTFDSIFASAASTVVPEEEDSKDSCSAEAAACTTPPNIDVAAVTLKILENYGSPDYTCIYRFRVHGEQILY